ncbi:glycosyltransferase family 2 protein [Synoicihabitans lomoniglobus]|uniref:Glycosyltransferase family 2 protein n=1 Tax=Synoicihabitans lomoniglobus TaxID=2909285 RepID=A0AAF0CPF4_9BACT|nr:glycosyltransferase family 2 protein [Opitutaceae bacterium LMO-M01]WED64459.1 glycosyltransferase family 2 protein [Opitutaceae bacterium LMO-M01]
MTPPSRTHLVLIPSYNTGPRLADTVTAALAQWSPVWVVVDGSTDGCDEAVRTLAAQDPRLRVITRPTNGGKGAAVATGVTAAHAAGFTHVLTMDADGQHPADHIAPFMAASQAQLAALILGRPVFGPEVPLERLHGRKLSVGLAYLEILGAGIDDPLFGFRVYPVAALARAFTTTRRARGFDFDPEVAVRLFWAGVPTVNLPAPCRYLAKNDGGVSHFHYLRDNLKLIWLHTRLLSQLLWRWPQIRRRRRRATS